MTAGATRSAGGPRERGNETGRLDAHAAPFSPKPCMFRATASPMSFRHR